MINKEELRLGNIVNYEQTHHVIVCLDILYSMSYWWKVPNDVYKHSYEELSPIPITEKLLDLCNFLDKDNIKVFVNGRYDLERLTGDSDEWGFYVDEKETNFIVKYIHELQNVYYIHEKKELEFKELNF